MAEKIWWAKRLIGSPDGLQFAFTLYTDDQEGLAWGEGQILLEGEPVWFGEGPDVHQNILRSVHELLQRNSCCRVKLRKLWFDVSLHCRKQHIFCSKHIGSALNYWPGRSIIPVPVWL